MTEIIVYVETPACSCCDSEDKGTLLALKAFIGKAKETLGEETRVKIYLESSEEYRTLKKETRKRLKPPIITLNGKIVANGRYPSVEKLKCIS